MSIWNKKIFINRINLTLKKIHVILHGNYMFMTGKLFKYDWKFIENCKFSIILCNLPIINM